MGHPKNNVMKEERGWRDYVKKVGGREVVIQCHNHTPRISTSDRILYRI